MKKDIKWLPRAWYIYIRLDVSSLILAPFKKDMTDMANWWYYDIKIKGIGTLRINDLHSKNSNFVCIKLFDVLLIIVVQSSSYAPNKRRNAEENFKIVMKSLSSKSLLLIKKLWWKHTKLQKACNVTPKII